MTHYLRALAARLRGLFGDRKAERELDDEIEMHLRLLTERYVRQGMTEADAASAARSQFGNITLLQEASREMRGIRIIETFIQDLRYGTRTLLKTPGFTLIIVITLALGIGINTTVFTYVNAVLFRGLTFVEPERVAFVWAINPARGDRRELVSQPEFEEWREQSQSFETMTGVIERARALTGAGEPERVSSAAVSANYFQTLGVRPYKGRWFLPDEDRPNAARVAVLNYNFWHRQFGADPAALQQTILLDGERYTIVGVAPQEESQLLVKADLLEPLILDPKQADRSLRNVLVIGRLKRGITVEQANAEMESVAGRIARQYSATNAGWSARVRTAPDQYLGAEGRIAVAMLISMVLCVLLIACFNVGGMQLARALARQKEIAIRLALGAGRLRLIRQLLTENLLIALLGGAAGLLLALWGMSFLHARYAATSPFLNQAKVDGRVLAATIAIALLSAILSGLAPIWRTTKPDLHAALKEGGRSLAVAFGTRMRSALVTAEISLALILLIVAGLMIRSILAMRTIEPGFDPNNLLTARITLPERDYPREQQQRDFFARAMAQIAAQPGIKFAGAIDALPLVGGGGGPTRSILVEGQPPDPSGRQHWERIDIATPDYFKASSIPLLLGRPFSAQDSTDGRPVALISQAMAQRYWPNEYPIDKRVKIEEGPNDAWISVIGIVGDVRDDYVDAPPAPRIYLPYAQRPTRDMSLVIRAEGDPLSVVPAVRNAVRAIDRNLPVYEVHSMRQCLFNDLSTTYLFVELLGTFALMALLLSAVGIYGVVAYAVSQRAREIGVRIAMGAQRGDVLKLVLWQGARLTSIGLAIGLTAAIALTRLIKSLLFGVTSADPFTFAGVATLLAIVSLLACYVPAHRATRVDPLVALRTE